MSIKNISKKAWITYTGSIMKGFNGAKYVFKSQQIDNEYPQQPDFDLVSLLAKAKQGNLTVDDLWKMACKLLPEAVKDWKHYLKTT